MTTQTIPDLRPLLLRSIDVTDALVNAVADDDLTLATPCDEFDVRALVDHLVMVVRRVRIVLGGGDFTHAVPTGATTLTELLLAWAEGRDALRDALPGFDHEAVIRAMGSTEEASFLCWQKPSADRRQPIPP